MSRLTQTIALLYGMETDDINALADELLNARIRAWKQGLSELIRASGGRRAPREPSGRDLDELRRMSREDAQSIARTWNKDVEREIERLRQQNPRANRQYYYSNLERWAAQRATWKDAQIALNTEQTTRQYARQRFYEENRLKTKMRFVLAGAPPVCGDCSRLFARGVVTERYVRSHPTPRHPNCAHEWRPVNTPKIPSREMWVG